MKETRPILIKITLFLILLNAFFWMFFGVITALGYHPGIPANEMLRWGMVVLAISCSIVLMVLVVFLGRHNRIAYGLTACILGLISVLTITDQFGISDLLVLLLTTITLLLLVLGRRWYFQLP
jgi:hypothetical protein